MLWRDKKRDVLYGRWGLRGDRRPIAVPTPTRHRSTRCLELWQHGATKAVIDWGSVECGLPRAMEVDVLP